MANLRNVIYSMLLKPIAFSLNIFLKIAVIKVADDCIADSAEFANFGQFLEVLQSMRLKRVSNCAYVISPQVSLC